jgi:hypothetical protein
MLPLLAAWWEEGAPFDINDQSRCISLFAPAADAWLTDGIALVVGPNDSLGQWGRLMIASLAGSTP